MKKDIKRDKDIPVVLYTGLDLLIFLILDFLNFTPFCVQQNAISGYYCSRILEISKQIWKDSGVRKTTVEIPDVESLTLCSFTYWRLVGDWNGHCPISDTSRR